MTLERNTLRLARVKTHYSLGEAIANWLEFEASSDMVRFINFLAADEEKSKSILWWVRKRDEKEREKEKAYEKSKFFKTIGEQFPELTLGEFDEYFAEYWFYFDAILTGANFKKDDDILSSIIAKEELIKIAKKLDEKPLFLFPDKKPMKENSGDTIDPRERNTLHLIIAALANKANVDISDTSRDRVAIINRELGFTKLPTIAEKTIRKHLGAAAKTANDKRE